MSNTLPARQRFSITCDGRTVPVVLWTPTGQCTGLVLACHGGSGHKESPAVLAIAEQFMKADIAVVAIDGPVHGERRADVDLDPVTARTAFRAAWRAGVGQTWMADDFASVLDRLLRDPVFSELPVGYIGVSMGTAYGLPFLARDPRIAAAAIGLWGTTYPASMHLAGYAQQVRCPAWFTIQWNDEFFDKAGSLELFDALGSADKRLVAYPGPHRELEGERLRDAVEFLVKRLKTSASDH